MKKLYFIFIIALTMVAGNFYNATAQAPEGITYQAEARDAAGKLLTNKVLAVKTTIHRGSSTGTAAWTKDYSVATDKYGLFAIVIGDAANETSFSQIEWGAGTYFLNVQIKSGTTWINTGTTQLLSVPYALYAKSAGSTKINETDPEFNASPSAGITSGNITNWNTAYGWGNHAGLYRNNTWVPTWTDVIGKPTFATVATSGNYNDLTNKPTIPIVPTNISAFTNDAGYITSSTGLTNFTESNYSYNSKTGVALKGLNTADNVDLVISSKGTGAILAQQPDGTNAGGDNRGTNAVDLQMSRSASTQAASGQYSVIAGGLMNTASGNVSFATGQGNTAGGYAAIAMGRNNTASSNNAVALGYNNTASGLGAFVTGISSQATGGSSMAIGNFLVAPSGYETVVGRFNTDYTPANTLTWDNSDRLFVIGNGTASNAKSNALTILKNANATLGGTLTVNGNGSNTSFTFPSGRGTSGQVLSTDGSGITNWQNLPNYLTSYTETDPVFGAWDKDYNDLTNKPTLFSGSYSDLTNRPTNLLGYGITDALSSSLTSTRIYVGNASNIATAVTLSGDATLSATGALTLANTGVSLGIYKSVTVDSKGRVLAGTNPTTLAGYGIMDAMAISHPAYAISTTNITNWNTAYSWGNHAGLYRPISYVPAWTEITANPFSISSAANNQLLKYNSTTAKWENWTPNYLTTETDPAVKAVNGLIKSNGNTISAAISGTDYLAPGEAVTNVTGTAPIISTGGTTPIISISPANTTAAGSMSSADKTKLDGIAAGAEVNVNADWNATNGDALILNKPNLSVYATKNMNNQNITNLADPVNAQDAATKAFVDALRSEVNFLKLKVEILAGTPVSELLASGATLENLLAAGAKTDQFVGVEYLGGKIAYFLQAGDPGYDANVPHGLIAAPSDQSNNIQWYNGSYITIGVTGTTIGTGNANTNAIVLNQSNGSYAAKLCYDLVLGGYSDWYLPSLDELAKLYQNRIAIGGFSNDDYWSSSELGSTAAARFLFLEGYYRSSQKENLHSVRAIRSF